MEIFKTHPEYTRVQISNHGNVRCSKTFKERYTRLNKQGYRCFMYSIDNKPKLLKVHRLVAELHLEPPSQKLIDECKNVHWGVPVVRHLDNDKTNNHYLNLEWCSNETNYRQAMSDGLIPALKGELNGRAELCEEQVHELCKFFEVGGMPKEAVRLFGISKQQATKIRAGFQWKHIWVQYDIKVNRRRKFIDQS